jgi:hypothetical protein
MAMSGGARLVIGHLAGGGTPDQFVSPTVGMVSPGSAAPLTSDRPSLPVIASLDTLSSSAFTSFFS